MDRAKRNKEKENIKSIKVKENLLDRDLLLFCRKQKSNHLDQVYLFTPEVGSEASAECHIAVKWR